MSIGACIESASVIYNYTCLPIAETDGKKPKQKPKKVLAISAEILYNK
jgi:hypothetical protein